MDTNDQEYLSQENDQAIQNDPQWTWFQIYYNLVRHPGEKTVEKILSNPRVNLNSAIGWASQIIYILFLTYAGLNELIRKLQFHGYQSRDLLTILFSILSMVTLYIFVLCAFTFVGHWLAKLLGGKGSLNNLVISAFVISVPIFLIMWVMYFVFSLIGLNQSGLDLFFFLAFYLYSFAIMIIAIKHVEKIGYGKAIVVFLAPLIPAALGYYYFFITYVYLIY